MADFDRHDDDDLLAGFHEPRTVATDLLDKVLGEEDSISVGPASGRVQEPEYQPVNQATMECARGPCRHLWCLTCRFGDYAIGGEIQLKRVRQCNAHYEPTELAEQNIYHCNLWWPAPFSFVPESLRALLRPRLRQLWEWILRKRGYDFSWRTWREDIFETDDPARRGNAKPGQAPSGAAIRSSRPPIGRQVDGGLMFNS